MKESLIADDLFRRAFIVALFILLGLALAIIITLPCSLIQLVQLLHPL